MQTIPAIGFTAWSGTGKTTLIEQLIRVFKKRQLRVAVIKHDAHDFEIDHEGKDSRRFTQAGADMTLLSSPQKTAVIETRPRVFSDLRNIIHDVDLILVEGFKAEDIPRIGLYRKASGNPFPEAKTPFAALVTDTPVAISPDIPQFSFADISGLADWILQYLGIC